MNFKFPIKWTGFANKSTHIGLKSANDSNSVYSRIIERTNARTRKDIDNWRQALRSAENFERPRRLLLYNLYDELVLDNHLSSIMSTRKFRMMGQAFKVVDINGQPMDEQTALLQSPWFYKFIDLAFDSIFYGTRLIEFQDPSDTGFNDVVVIPGRHVVPEEGGFLANAYDTTPIPYRDTPLMNFLIEVGGIRDLGLLAKAAPNMLWKKNTMMAWSEYTEIFGMPMRVGKVNSRLTADQERMAQNLKDMGSAAYAVMQEGEEISFIESTKGDAYMVYDKMVERANSEMSKLILGQTMTTDVGANGSKAQATVHQQQGDEIAKADLMFMRNLVNTELFRVLKINGFNFDKCRFVWDVADDITLDQWNIDAGLLLNFEIDKQYFIDKYRVPIIGIKTPAAPADPNPAPTAKGKKGLNILKLHADLYDLYNNKKEDKPEDDCC